MCAGTLECQKKSKKKKRNVTRCLAPKSKKWLMIAGVLRKVGHHDELFKPRRGGGCQEGKRKKKLMKRYI